MNLERKREYIISHSIDIQVEIEPVEFGYIISKIGSSGGDVDDGIHMQAQIDKKPNFATKNHR